MKELILSNIERDFILKLIADRKRLDGREAFAYRNIDISFGLDRGCCDVKVGATRVMAQVSCEVTVPKDTRPNEGILVVNVELSPMAAPHFEAGRPSDKSIEIHQMLERCLRESRCLDTESLCIVFGQKVWQIRVDIHVLNFDGNITDASSIAAIAALSHFRRPDVTVCGDEITIHPVEDRDPIPLSVYHVPVCTTFAFYDVGKFMVIDPTQREELVAEGFMIIAMNKHREICLLKMSGSMLLLKEQVLRCTSIAATKAADITELVQTALRKDADAKLAVTKQRIIVGPAMTSEKPTDTVAAVIDGASESCDLSSAKQQAVKTVTLSGSESDDNDMTADSADVYVLDSGVAAVGRGGASTWEQYSSEVDEDIKTFRPTALAEEKTSDSDDDDDDSDSEEDDVCVINK